MRVVADEMYYDNYKFLVELDTGAEVGTSQLTVWFAEKINVDSIPLSHFKPDQLLKALQEPHRSQLRAQLENEQSACRKAFEQEIADIQRSFSAIDAKMGHKQSKDAKRRIKDLRRQLNITLQRLNADFSHRLVQPLERGCFYREVLQQECNLFNEERFLRDFYFEETNTKYIRNFCRKFATDEAYRQLVLARETEWAKRNALFLRNLSLSMGEPSSLIQAVNDDNCDDNCKERDLFHWIGKHCEAILALPEYQHLQQIDNDCKIQGKELDPFIQPAVELFNRLPDVSLLHACQGVSGKVNFQGREILVPSKHAENAYVSFSVLGQSAKRAIEGLLPKFPAITDMPLPGTFALRPVLRSNGDNMLFRVELVKLAKCLVDRVDKEP